MSTEMDDLTRTIMDYAEKHVGTARETLGLQFDYSESSLAHLDEAISKYHADGNLLDTTILSYGSYVGETIRRNLGAQWVQDERGVASLQNVAGLNIQAFPFSWTQSRFDNGTGDSLAFKYSALKNEVTQQGGAVAVVPAARKMSISVEDPASGAAMQQLGRAPFLVGVMIAAADGKVDKKEMQTFARILADLDTCQSNLLKAVIKGVTLPNMESYFADLGSKQTDFLGELKSISAILDEQFPEQARGFRESLLSLGHAIANASGGVFGMGDKVDADEAGMLAAIAEAVGLYGAEGAGAGATSEDLQQLGRAPIVIFLAVAAADGKVDKKECQAFQKILESAENFPNDLMKTALETVTMPQFDDLFEQITSQGFDPFTELQSVGQMLDQKHPREAVVCKRTLVAIGHKIAESSGGLFGFGKKIDETEMQALAAIAMALGLIDETGKVR